MVCRSGSTNKILTMIAILYWIILVLSVLGLFAPADWTYAPRINSFAAVVLFILIGLKVMPVAL